MARIRTIKPEFFTSEDIVDLDPFARLLYIALWCEADREGRLEWKPRTFKMRYLPADDIDHNAICNAIVDAGLVVLYEVDGKQYAEIPTFLEHQIINNRERESAIPARVSDSLSRVNDACVTRESGREGKGREGKESGGDEKSPEYAFEGEVIKIRPSQANQWRKSFPLVDLIPELQAADAYYVDNPPKNGKWFFAASNWLKRANEQKTPKSTSTPTPGRMSPEALAKLDEEFVL